MKGIVSRFILFVLTILVTASCSAPVMQRQSTNTTPIIKKVAVLPFSNISGHRDASNIVTGMFVTEIFKSGRFSVEEPGNIAQFMIQERVDNIGEMELDRLKILGKRMGVDAVITGTVEEFDDSRSGSLPKVSIVARMVDSHSGRLVWSAQNKGKGDDYIIIFDIGEIRTVTTLAQKIIGEMIKTIK